MPWQGVTPVELRMEFTRAYASGLYTMTELCDQYAISRKTGYKRVWRYEAGGRSGLADRSRRPVHRPHATDAEVVERLCEARRRHPTWRARKLIAVLGRQLPDLPWPARSTRVRVAEGPRLGAIPAAAAPLASGRQSLAGDHARQ